jgi:hypothetical protein
MANIILPDIHFALLLGLHPSVSISLLIYLSLLHKFASQAIGLGVRLSAGTPQ